MNGIRVMNAYLCDKETALENLSKEDLIKVVSSRDEEIDYLKSQLAMYKLCLLRDNLWCCSILWFVADPLLLLFTNHQKFRQRKVDKFLI
ncbi:hypothetical protein [Sphingobacterium zeae]|uniref:hypothetical protein n=1 Tax=Sphingobacterium zeae TaxID=1776859 RepID=UPI00361F3F68